RDWRIDAEPVVEDDGLGGTERSDGFQVLVNHADRCRTFTDRSRYALAGSVAGVTRREDAGHARLEQKRIAIDRPRLRPPAIDQQIASGENESLRVALD